MADGSGREKDGGERRCRLWVDIALGGALFFLALGIRLHHHELARIDNAMRGDAGEYFTGAYNWVRYGIYSNNRHEFPARPAQIQVTRPLGYPAFLALFISPNCSSEEFDRRVRTVQALAGSFLTVLVYGAARRAFRPGLAALAGALTAASPHLIALEFLLLTETLFALLLFLGGLAIEWARWRPRWWTGVLAGICFAVLTMLHPRGAPFALVLGLAFLVRPGAWGWQERRGIVRQWAVFFATFILLSQWEGHIRTPPGTPSLTERYLWHQVYVGADVDFEQFAPSRRSAERWKEQERRIHDVGYGWSKLREDMRTRPWTYLRWFCGGKLIYLMCWDNPYRAGVHETGMVRDPFLDDPWLSLVYRTMRMLNAGVVVLALWAPVSLLNSLVRRRMPVIPPSLLIPCLILLGYVGLFTLFQPMPRYAAALRPCMYWLALYGVAQLARIVRDLWVGRRSDG